MENKQNNFLMGAVVALAGSLVGVGAVLSADLAFNGVNANWAKDQNSTIRDSYNRGDVLRKAAGSVPAGNPRSILYGSEKFVLPEDLEAECKKETRYASTRYWRCLAEAREGNYYRIRQSELPKLGY